MTTTNALFDIKPEEAAGNIGTKTAATRAIRACLGKLEGDDLIDAINDLREVIAAYSPFSSEPVDFVRWVRNDDVKANDYNPNKVAPPEMELLRVSIDSDGYTQPIVTMLDDDGKRTVIDGFHRHRVGKEFPTIEQRVHGRLPVVQIRDDRTGRNDRIAATIRHNRARGKHQVDAMSDIVIELKKRNWSDLKIGRELGMDPDEVLRLCQVSGLAEIFADQDFSKSWDIITDGPIDLEEEFAGLDEGDLDEDEEES